MTQQLLIDSYPISLSLEENSSGKLVAKGEFGRCDVPTQNGRLYPRRLYEREIGKLNQTISKRRCFGELDHPTDGKTKLQRVSHIITTLQIDDDGRVIGEAEILDTPAGKTLRAILEGGAEVGVSSRGFGSVSNQGGKNVVGEDFALKTFDFVADPAMQSAYPEIHVESQEDYNSSMLENEFPDLVDGIKESLKASLESQIRSELQDRFAINLGQQMVDLKTQVEEDVRKELMNNPKFNGSQAVLEQVSRLVSEFKEESTDYAVYEDCIEEQKREIGNLNLLLEDALNEQNKLNYELTLEKQIASHPRSENIRRLIGNPLMYESIELLNERISEVVEGYESFIVDESLSVHEEYEKQVSDIRSSVSILKEEYDEELSSLKKYVAKIEEELISERDRADRAVEIAERLDDRLKLTESQNYKQKRVSKYTNQNELMNLIESVEDKDTIDRIVETHSSSRIRDPELEKARQNIARGKRRSSSESLNESEEISNLGERLFDGMSKSKLKQLSGI